MGDHQVGKTAGSTANRCTLIFFRKTLYLVFVSKREGENQRSLDMTSRRDARVVIQCMTWQRVRRVSEERWTPVTWDHRPVVPRKSRSLYVCRKKLVDTANELLNASQLFDVFGGGGKSDLGLKIFEKMPSSGAILIPGIKCMGVFCV